MKLGHRHFIHGFEILWGNKNASMENLKTSLPELELVKLKQIHSSIVRIQTTNDSVAGQEGDAIITNQRNIALAVSTADCLPVMIIQPNSGWFAGIHAGWRGVANQIVPSALSLLLQSSKSDEAVCVWIGPHIQFADFEVGFDVQKEILSSLQSTPAACSRQLNSEKALVNLSMVVQQQLQEAKLPVEKIWTSAESTVTSQSYHSHRRDRERSGRQHSLILRKSFS